MRNDGPAAPAAVQCRAITTQDVPAIVDLLKKGFGTQRSRRFWSRMLERMTNYPTPPGMPKYGFMLEHAGRPVGVLLLISSLVGGDQAPSVRCNVSSWYVEPEFRPYGTLLVSRALREKSVTYINISPAPHTRPILEAQGYRRYATGLFLSLPALSAAPGSAVAIKTADAELAMRLDRSEQDLLRAHAAFGCLSVWCIDGAEAHPFVFVRRVVWRVIPCFQLVYCRDMADFVRFAQPLGRYLGWRGRPLVLLDANGPVAGLVGRYFDGVRPKYFKGPNRPRLGDLAYTEASLFGI